jgi:hypothetical protein
MVKTHIGVKWPNIETKPMTGTIAYEVMTKRGIPGPGVYDRKHSLPYSQTLPRRQQRLTGIASLSASLYTAPMLGGPHGGKFNNSKSRRLIDQVVYDGRKLPGPGQYDGTYEPVDVPLAGESLCPCNISQYSQSYLCVLHCIHLPLCHHCRRRRHHHV